jgi:subtilase family serine protease
VDDEKDEAKEKSLAGLDPGKEVEVRFDDVPLKRGQHRLTAMVDAKKSVAESDENNNELKFTVNCRDD